MIGLGNRLSGYARKNSSEGTATVSSGAVAVPAGNIVLMRVDNEGAAATDDINTLNGGNVGQILIIRSTSAARVPTFLTASGNLRLKGDVTLSDTETALIVFKDENGNWIQF